MDKIALLGLGIGLGMVGVYGIGDVVNWSVNTYVDAKWMISSLFEEAEPGPTSTSSECPECQPLFGGSPLRFYQYRNQTYATSGPIPIIEQLDQVYDADERITRIETMPAGIGSDNDAELTRVLTCLAGPLVDFHGQIPKLDLVKSLVSIDLTDVQAITVHTENYSYFKII
jgi:hypothetical protein